MRVLRRGPVAACYWLLALALSVWVGVAVSGWAGRSAGSDQPTPDGEVTTSGAQIVYGIVGFVLGMLGVIALFAAIWMALWARERRSQPAEEYADDDADFEDMLAGDEDEDSRS